MSYEIEPSTPRADQPPKGFPWGCLIGGCLGVVLLMVGGMVAIGVGTYWFYQKQIAQYTSETPRELPAVNLSEEEITKVADRVEAFQEKVKQGETAEELVLTAEDLNALISREEELRGRVYVTIADGQVQAEVSFPTDALPGAKGRYFNGAATLEASLSDGVLIVRVQNAEVNGEPLPEAIMTQLRNENLAKDIYKDPESAAKLRNFEKLEIQGDKIILTPRVPAATDKASEAAPPSNPSAEPEVPGDSPETADAL